MAELEGQIQSELRGEGCWVPPVVKSDLPTQETQRHRFDPCGGRSPGGGHDSQLQYSYLKNPMVKEPVKLRSRGLQGWTRLSDSASKDRRKERPRLSRGGRC